MTKAGRASFTGLGRLDQIPKPIPDDDDPPVPTNPTDTDPAQPALTVDSDPPTVAMLDRSAGSPTETGPTENSREVSPDDRGNWAAASSDEPPATRRTRRNAPAAAGQTRTASTGTGERHSAATVRLHQPAADALYDAFLDERRNIDPRMSYPQFASRIVMAGLDSERRRQARQRD